jgi:hypothetical protein
MDVMVKIMINRQNIFLILDYRQTTMVIFTTVSLHAVTIFRNRYAVQFLIYSILTVN